MESKPRKLLDQVRDATGHKNIETTMIDTHVLNRGGRGVRSSLDAWGAIAHQVLSDSPITRKTRTRNLCRAN